MLSRGTSVGGLAVIAGAAILLATSGPSSALTLASPSLEQTFVKSGVEPVWWDRWGRWHPNAWHAWGWHHPVYGFYGPPTRRCWVGPWGGWRCTW
jgi:hypothetical protein